MAPKKVYAQSSIESFFSKKPAPSTKKDSASTTPLEGSSFNSVVSTQSSLGELPERKRPDHQQEPASQSQNHGSPFPLRGPPPSSNPHIQDIPTSPAASTVFVDDGNTSSRPPLSSSNNFPDSSMSLGFPRDADAKSSFPAPSQETIASVDPFASQSPVKSPGNHMLEVPGWSSPARPSTPPQISASISNGGTPTRTLFAQNDGGSTASKRTAVMASFSPMKARPPTKIAKKSPTPSLRTPSDASPFSSTPQMPSSPTSPVAKKATFDRAMEIKGSDDEDDDISDCSLPDIDSFIPSKVKISEALVTAKVGAATPDKRRTRGTKLQSPFALSNKTRKFDIKTLIAHQRTDDAIAAGFKMATEELASSAIKSEVDSNSILTNSPSTIRKQFISMAGVKEETAGKALRAMERTQHANSEQTSFYFFKPSHSAWAERPGPFPKAAARGPWTLLVKEGTRRRHIESGFFSKVAGQLAIPDDIYLWLVDSMRMEKSPVARSAYCEILAGASSEQIQRLVKPETLRGICQGLGSVDDFDNDRLRSVSEREAAYAGRDWGSLITHLEWLYSAARNLGQDVIQHAVSHLLRMAADRALLSNPEVLFAHQTALAELVGRVEASSWDEFCEEAASSLHRAFGTDHLLVLPLQSSSSTSDRIRQLRRRLALGFFLGDPSKARQHPDQATLLSEVLERLGRDDFKITRKTDYLCLRARMRMLDIAIDDGALAQREEGFEGEKRFNEDIDEVSRRLRDIWGSINDAGALYLTRTQAKSTIDCMQKRLTYAERTKPVPKQSVFDIPRKQDDTPSVKSKLFMQKFIGNLKKPRPASALGKTPDASDGGSSDVEATFMTAMGD
ncbi:hypothetical protein F5X68DRAFT_257758 [Plectosphaerella plurivora]|uniref:Uncharacterized protein n=1 Tax=Plectosphaerella plurivora TaxID=936078 RepID=A0A9P8VPD5_9PEZI|nr:hypothetical protein F5X68DRAFT_257758 [Plectosphaerella plurivora]